VSICINFGAIGSFGVKFARQNKCTELPKIKDTPVHLFSHDFNVILELMLRDVVCNPIFLEIDTPKQVHGGS
jgi:hypothetical protein